MIRRFLFISKSVLSEPISYDPIEKESLDEFVHELENNSTEDECKREALWQKKLEEQKNQPWSH